MTEDSAASDRASWQQWVRDREGAVSSPTGNLALVDFQPIGAEPQPVRGMPGEIWRSPADAGAWVRPTGDGLTLLDDRATGWRPVVEPVFVDRLGASGVPLLGAGERSADVFSLDGSDYELRLYDAASEKRSRFAGIAVYDFDPAWRVEGELRAYAETAQVPWEFTRATDTGHTKTVPGVIAVVIAGEEYEFSAFADGDHLVLVFADGTTGAESYAPGRFLRFAPPAPGGTAVPLDFNRAFVPPCGFSDFYSCPIPPAQNRVRVPVRAGEQKVLWRE